MTAAERSNRPQVAFQEGGEGGSRGCLRLQLSTRGGKRFIISAASIFFQISQNANNIIHLSFVCIALFADEQTSTEGKF